jgi:hypothetical protein
LNCSAVHLLLAAVFVGQFAVKLADNLVPLLKDNNFRICLSAIVCLRHIAPHLGKLTKPVLNQVCNSVIICFGNGKVEIREQAQLALLDLIHASNVDEVFEFVVAAAKHSNAHIRESVIRFIALAVRELSALHELSFAELLPVVVETLNDRGSEVREAAVAALEIM